MPSDRSSRRRSSPKGNRAASVSRSLSRTGIVTRNDRRREGVQCRQVDGTVFVTVDLDEPERGGAAEMAATIEQDLINAGFSVERNGWRLTVSRPEWEH